MRRFRCRIALACVLVFACLGIGQDKDKPKPNLKDFYEKLIPADARLKKAAKEGNEAVMIQAKAERAALAKLAVGAEITAIMVYQENRVERPKQIGKGRVMPGKATMIYSIMIRHEDENGNRVLATARMLPNNEAFILAKIVSTVKPKDKFKIKGTIVRCEMNASVAFTIAVSDFEKVPDLDK